MTTFTANRNYEEVLKLLKKGVTPYSHNQIGRCILYITSEAGDLAMVRLLVEWGADPGWIDLNSKKTALQIAKEKNHTEVVKSVTKEISSCL